MTNLRANSTVFATGTEMNAKNLYIYGGSLMYVPSFQGSVSGYTSGGASPAASNIIDKFSFASNGNASDVGDLTVARQGPGGHSSSVSGYTSGGGGAPRTNIIDKFPFASNGNASDVGDLLDIIGYFASCSSADNAYVVGGASALVVPGAYGPVVSPTPKNVIQKFPFATDANATDVADISQLTEQNAGHSSISNGYSSGGLTPPPGAYVPGVIGTIRKFPFATNSDATNVASLYIGGRLGAGISSSEHGYTTGAGPASFPNLNNVIQKFPFASDANASDVGDMTIARWQAAGQSSLSHGYTSGGTGPAPGAAPGTPPPAQPIKNQIDRFPFASNANATDVGDLTVTRQNVAGQQV